MISSDPLTLTLEGTLEEIQSISNVAHRDDVTC